MKPTLPQKKWLRDYLQTVMKYRETYEEVYDHMLLAIEDEPEHEFFETTVANVINRDFGGTDGLYELEDNCKLAVDDTAQAQFRDNFKSWFTSPLAFATIAMFMGLFYLLFSPIKTGVALISLFFILLILPLIICSIRAARLGYKYGESKTSIKDEVFRKVAFTSDRAIWQVISISIGAQLITNFLFMINDYLGLAAGIFVICLLIWPHIRQLILKFKNRNDRDASATIKIRLIPLKEKLFYGWLSLVFLAIDLITKFVHKAKGSPAPSKPVKSVLIFTETFGYSIIASVLVLMIINLVVVIKLYRSEFKTNMLIN
jgi:hypothetical protein